MLSLKSIYRIQSEYGVSDGTFRGEEVALETYINDCRMFLKDSFPKNFSKLSNEEKNTVTHNLVTTFCKDNRVKVKGFVKPDGTMDYDYLLREVIAYTMGEGILEDALNDPEVDEIQINDKNTIFIQKGGRLIPYLDKRGKPRRFFSDEEVISLLSRLTTDGKGEGAVFNEGNPILNTKTAKHHYRISAVHHSANTSAPEPYNFNVTSVVIRKFKEVKLTIPDLIKYGAITPLMGDLFKVLGKAGVTMFFVGPTGCGKTTLLNIVVNEAPMSKRILLVQNPTEISFFERDAYERAKRNVVHWEVITKASLEQLADNTLRFTPELTVIGESRKASEFGILYTMIENGQPTVGSFHAESCIGGLYRFATQAARDTGDNKKDILESLCNSINVMVSTFRYPDGTRRVTELAEVTGFKDGAPEVRTLFKFEETGEIELNEYGLEVVKGNFVHVNPISEKLVSKCFKAGVSKKELEPFMNVK